MVKFIGLVLGGVAVGIIIDRIIITVKENRRIEKEKILERCFGEPMYTNRFSIKEVRDWIKAREEKLKNGAKAVVLKANSDTLRSIGEDLDIGNVIKNNLVLAIVNETNHSIEDSLLIKYEVLDDKLEESLDKGDGVLVVEA